MNVIISMELAEGLANYLAGRPYSEVAQGMPALLQAIQAAKQPPVEPKEEVKAEESHTNC